MGKQSGFTLLELIIVIVILGALAAIVMPNLLTWMPKYRLKSAARDLYSNMQLAKIAAIKDGSTSTITYNSGPDRYAITGAMTDTVTLADYGNGVQFDPAPGTGLFSVTSTVFDSRGMVSSAIGYAYLSNEDGSIRYRVGALISGVIQLQQPVDPNNIGGVWE